MPLFLSASTDLQILLDQAESLRTSKPNETKKLLLQLEPKFDVLTELQKHQLLFIKAYMYGFEGSQDKAIELAKSIQKSPYIAYQIKANLLLATVHEHKKDFLRAYEYLYNSLYVSQELASADSLLQLNLYTVATQLHLSAGAYAKAYDFASTIITTAENNRALCIGNALMLNASVRMKKPFPFEDTIQKTIDICQKANEPLIRNATDIYAAELYVEENPAKVRDKMQQILPELESIGYLYTIIQARYFLGYAMLRLDDLQQAEQILTQVLEQATRLHDNRTANETLLLLAQLYEKTGNTAAALTAYKDHITALNAYINEYKERSVAYHMAQTNFMENENRLALLRSQNDLLQLEGELQRADKRRTIMIAIILVLTLLTVIYLLNTKRSQLNRLATTDFLTRLFNRRYFSETVSRQLDNRRQQEHYSLIVFDIDLFKTINDKYGHATGDQVLATIADRCRQHIRQQDILARIGGEEFALFLPGCHLDAAYSIAEQCRLSIENTPIVIEEQMIKVTASFGVASSKTADFDTLLKHADTALYQAKAGGRNCSRIFNSHS